MSPDSVSVVLDSLMIVASLAFYEPVLASPKQYTQSSLKLQTHIEFSSAQACSIRSEHTFYLFRWAIYALDPAAPSNSRLFSR